MFNQHTRFDNVHERVASPDAPDSTDDDDQNTSEGPAANGNGGRGGNLAPRQYDNEYARKRAEIFQAAKARLNGQKTGDGVSRPAAAKASAGPTTAAPQKRRGPGRPPRRPAPPPLEKKGIVDAPDDPENKMEFAYEEPSMFKALFTYFKNIKAKEIRIRFSPDSITFFARDHGKTSRTVARVAGEHVNWYYCEEEFWIGLSREMVEKIFSCVDKSFSKISIVHRIDDPDSLTFIFKDMDVEKECNHKIGVSSLDDDEDLIAAEKELTAEALDAYPVEFTLTDKQFKKSVSDIAAQNPTFSIEKLGELPLQFTYSKVGDTYHEVYRNGEKIKLKSSVATGRVFRCTVTTANVKSLAASMVTEDVRVFAKETDFILFRSAIEEKALIVSTLVNLT
jgi:hypothetical protein